MARYLGSQCRLCRAEKTKLFLKGTRCYSDKCAISRKRNAPGKAPRRRTRKLSDYGIQLREKQKARRMYGMLEKQFRIEYVRPKKKASGRPKHLRLIPKADSRYKDDYTQIDFWIADKIDLPAKIVAQSSETDIFEISFSDIKINKKLKSSVFKVKKPQDFSENKTILEQK